MQAQICKSLVIFFFTKYTSNKEFIEKELTLKDNKFIKRPLPHIPWPHPNLVAEVKTEGFDLLSKESLSMQVKILLQW